MINILTLPGNGLFAVVLRLAMQGIIPNSIEISDQALDELHAIIARNIGNKKAEDFSREDLHNLADFLLTASVLCLNIQNE